jgi:hypothetical protein
MAFFVELAQGKNASSEMTIDKITPVADIDLQQQIFIRNCHAAKISYEKTLLI